MSAVSGGGPESLPYTQVFNYYHVDDPDAGVDVEFRLIYDGPLLSEECKDKGTVNVGAVGRATEKHRLRKHFHPQLRQLWKMDPGLREQGGKYFTRHTTPHNRVDYPGPGVPQIVPAMPDNPLAKTWLDWIAGDHVVCEGNRFIPLVSKAGGFTCALDIMFLRRDDPGGLVKNGGDIDNRIKVLLDGLRMPTKVTELGGYTIDQNDEDPFYCLLEDDRLITSISVTTDRLICPPRPNEGMNDVRLVIHVTVVNPIALFAGGRLV